MEAGHRRPQAGKRGPARTTQGPCPGGVNMPRPGLPNSQGGEYSSQHSRQHFDGVTPMQHLPWGSHGPVSDPRTLRPLERWESRGHQPAGGGISLDSPDGRGRNGHSGYPPGVAGGRADAVPRPMNGHSGYPTGYPQRLPNAQDSLPRQPRPVNDPYYSTGHFMDSASGGPGRSPFPLPSREHQVPDWLLQDDGGGEYQHDIEWEGVLRSPKQPSERQIRILRSYGPSDWQMVRHCGWNGGKQDDGAVRDLFGELLHTTGYHFVKDGFISFVKLPDNLPHDRFRRELRRLAAAMNLQRPRDTSVTHRVFKNNRSRLVTHFLPLHVGVDECRVMTNASGIEDA